MKSKRTQLLGTALRVCIASVAASALATGQTVDGSSGVDMGGTGQISGAPHITFPSTSGGALTWSSAALQGFVIPAGQLTGIDTAGNSVAAADLLPIQSQSLAVVAPSGAIQASLTTGGLNLWNPTAGGGAGALESALSYSAGGVLQSNGSPVVTAANIGTVAPNAALWTDAGTYLRPAASANFRIDELTGRFSAGAGGSTTNATAYHQWFAESTDRNVLRGTFTNHVAAINTAIATGNTFGSETRLGLNVATGITAPSSAQIGLYGQAIATGAGTIPILTGARANVTNTGTGVVNTARGLEVFASGAQSSAGIYIGTITGSVESLAIDSAASAASHFTGNIGIGRDEARDTSYPLHIAKSSSLGLDLLRIENQDQSFAGVRGSARLQIAGQISNATSGIGAIDFVNYDFENGAGSEYVAARILAHGGDLDGANDGGLYFYTVEDNTLSADFRMFADGSMTFGNDGKQNGTMLYGQWVQAVDDDKEAMRFVNTITTTFDHPTASFGYLFLQNVGIGAGVVENNHAYALYGNLALPSSHVGTIAGINAVYANAALGASTTGSVDEARGVFSAVSVTASGFAGPDGIVGTADDTGVQGTITNGIGFYAGGIDGTNQFAFYNPSTTDANWFAGSVGIGAANSAPEEKLDLNGRMLIRPSGSTAPAPTTGFVIWVDNTGVMKATSSAGNTTTLANP